MKEGLLQRETPDVFKRKTPPNMNSFKCLWNINVVDGASQYASEKLMGTGMSHQILMKLVNSTSRYCGTLVN